jgi:hypothetical protein
MQYYTSMHHLKSVSLVSFLLLAPIGTALASLGGSEKSVETDRKKTFTAEAHSTTLKAYTMHEIKNDHLTIREYSSNGVIFAITWKGSTHPDLSDLLGKYFEDYRQSLQASPRFRGARAQSRVEGRQVVVEKSGHMRAMQGKAYVLSLMPQGVSVHELE